MKTMIRMIAAIVLITWVVAYFPVCVSAHPGRTDSKGGHTNHSTGEYHYHHGYPAHDHYDMDGDGTVDCPYDFADKTESKSTADIEKSKTKKGLSGVLIGIVAFGLYVFFMFILPFLIS